MEIDLGWGFSLLTVVGSLGAAWGGARAAINGTKERVKEVGVQLAQHVKDDLAVQLDAVDRLARIETKLDAVLEEQD